jgi:type IV secretion system protein TrbE
MTDESRSSQELIPYQNVVSPGVILMKDGGLLAGFEVAGVDIEKLSPGEIWLAAQKLQSALSTLPGGAMIWKVTKKRISYDYLTPGECTNPVSNWMEQRHRQQFESGNAFSFNTFYFICVRPKGGIDGFFERKEFYQYTQGYSFLKAIFSAFKDVQDPMRMLDIERGKLSRHISEFETVLQNFVSLAKDLSPKRLASDDLVQNLDEMVNCRPSRSQPPPGVLLDSWLPSGHLTPGAAALRFDGPNKVYAAVLAIKEFKTILTPGILTSTAQIPSELNLVQAVQILDDGGSNVIENTIKLIRYTSVGMVKAVVAKLTNSNPEAVIGHDQILADAEAAMVARNAQNLTFALHQTSVIAFADSIENLERQVIAIRQSLENTGFKLVRETKGTLSVWAASLPGAWQFIKRDVPNGLDAIADMLINFAIPRGHANVPHLSMVLKRKVNGLATFLNRMGGASVMPGIDRQNGHLLALAPSRSGKSVLLGFLLALTNRYSANVLVLDFDRSHRVVTNMMGGTYITHSNERKFQINPFVALRDGKTGITWLNDWLINRAESRGERLSPSDVEEVGQTLRILRDQFEANTDPHKTLPYLEEFVALLNIAHLKMRFSEWIGDGTHASVFNHIGDDFTDQDAQYKQPWLAFDATVYLNNPVLAPAWVDYILYATYRKLDGTPTYILIEEAWQVFSNKTFRPILVKWIKTLLKRNGYLWCATQSVADFEDDPMLRGLLESFGVKIFFGNPDLLSSETLQEKYAKVCSLSSHELEILKSVVPREECYVKSQTLSRVFRTGLSPELLACVRSEIHIQAMLDAHMENNPKNWRETFIAEVLESE